MSFADELVSLYKLLRINSNVSLDEKYINKYINIINNNEKAKKYLYTQNEKFFDYIPIQFSEIHIIKSYLSSETDIIIWKSLQMLYLYGANIYGGDNTYIASLIDLHNNNDNNNDDDDVNDFNNVNDINEISSEHLDLINNQISILSSYTNTSIPLNSSNIKDLYNTISTNKAFKKFIKKIAKLFSTKHPILPDSDVIQLFISSINDMFTIISNNKSSETNDNNMSSILNMIYYIEKPLCNLCKAILSVDNTSPEKIVNLFKISINNLDKSIDTSSINIDEILTLFSTITSLSGNNNQSNTDNINNNNTVKPLTEQQIQELENYWKHKLSKGK